MDYQVCAKEIYEAIGKKENIVSVAHCATRLRMVIGDNTKCDKKVIEEIQGVKGVFEAAGQLQIILGTGTVNKVFAELIQIADIEAGTKEEVKRAAGKKEHFVKRGIKTLGDIFVPIIPAIVASGLLMGLLEGISKLFPQIGDSGTYVVIHLFSNAAFVFLPILIAMSAAKVFGGNIFLGAVIGMVMIHPDLMNAWAVAGAESIPKAEVWFGLYEINLVGYQGHVIPIIMGVWLLSTIEKKLHKVVPEMIDLFVTPLVSVLITGYVTLTIIGPVFSLLENYVLEGAQILLTLPLGIGAFFIGAGYAPTVVAGVHHMYNAIEAGLLSSTGINTWMPIATAANIAQAGAALAVGLKTKDVKLKGMALPASFSAFLGITEPAIFGVNIRYTKSFIAGCIGGACGAMFAGIMQVGATAYGVTGLFGFLITTNDWFYYLLIMLIAGGVAFALSWILFQEKSKDENSTGPTCLISPIKGKCIPLSEVSDEVFAGETLGKGIAFLPEDGTVYAPYDGVVTAAFDTKHAIGLTLSNGIELLIHVGINTVELEGRYFEYFVEEDQAVKQGDLLIRFDMEQIKAQGYSLETPMVITNSDDYRKIEAVVNGKIEKTAEVLKIWES